MPPSDYPFPSVNRRTLLAGAAASAATALSGCVNVPSGLPLTAPPTVEPPQLAFGEDPRTIYGPMVDNEHMIPAVPIEKLDPSLYRQEVPDPTGEAPGTIVVDTANHFLYLVRPGGSALRYGVGLGRAGFGWAGRAEIARKATWPKWYPPSEMIDRQPELEEYRAIYDEENGTWNGGMEGGIMNPLGARALYIYEDGKDTLYRVHGSPEWWTIGRNVSSGCVRMMNQDVIDLYDRVPVGSPILVTSSLGTV